MRYASVLCALVLAAFVASPGFAAKPFTPDQVPAPLKAWLPWVMNDITHDSCPYFYDRVQEHVCSWPTQLSLDVGAKGASFTYQFTVYDTPDKKPVRIMLPGTHESWPQNVEVNKRPIAILPSEDRPSVMVTQGTYTVTGIFQWDTVPVSLHVPAAMGLVRLKMEGKEVTIPDIEDEQVWISRNTGKSEQAEENRLETKIFRKVTDSIPLMLETSVRLEVSGKQREETLGKILPEGFILTGVNSELPARLDSDGTLRMQLRPGTWNVTVDARYPGPVTKLSLPQGDDETGHQEIWSFEPMNQLRLTQVEGVQAIDPSQTDLPQEWRRFPAYLMKARSFFTLSEKKRGITETVPDQLSLSRDIWLDFSGRGFTFKDTIGGVIRQSTRLEAGDGVELGDATINGRSQFITHINDKSAPGVEVREGPISLDAGSRIESGTPQFSATGWKSSFEHVSAQLYLPPGWSLFTYSGVDSVSYSWISSWSLLDIFLVLLTVVATAKLYDWRAGMLALITLTLLQHELTGFTQLVLLILAGVALVRYLPEGKLRTYVSWGRSALFLLLICAVLPFMIQHIREAVYPQLNPAWADYHAQSSLSDSFGALQEQQKTITYGSANGGYAGRRFMRHKESIAQEPVNAQEQNELTIQPGSLPAAVAGDQNAIEQPFASLASPPPLPPAPMMSSAVPQMKAMPRNYNLNAAMAKKAEHIGGRLRHVGGVVSTYAMPQEENYQQYAPDTKVQTGFGNASWRSNAIALNWNGMVDPSVTLKLYLISARENLVLAILRVVLMVSFIALLLGNQLPRLKRVFTMSGPAALMFLAVLAFTMTANPVMAAPIEKAETDNASFPPDSLLQELKEKLEQTINEPPSCAPLCASVAKTDITVAGNMLTILEEVHAGGNIALPLPGGLASWRPSVVTVDDASATALMQNESGYLYVNLGSGVHRVKLEGALPFGRDAVGISLPLASHYTSAQGQGWDVQGIHENGHADASLQLIRTAKHNADEEKTLERTDIRPFFQLERSFVLAQQWRVTTVVRRITPDDVPAAVHIPLLPGETITTADIQVKDGEAYANFNPGAGEVTWQSVVMPAPSLKLIAAKDKPWSETWRLTVSNLWHASTTGIPRVYLSDAEAAGLNSNGNPVNFWQWQPWPGESVTMDISRPQGIIGDTRTMDASSLTITPGERSMELTLGMTVRSSLGGQQEVTLPDNAVLMQVQRQGVTLPMQLKQSVLPLPLVPGINEFFIRWKQNEALPAKFKTPVIIIGLPRSVNASTTLELPADRWLLFAHGPQVGPALLFWSWLPVILILSFALGRLPLTPLRMQHWFLLLLGMNQATFFASFLVVAWLLALGWRSRNAQVFKHELAFNLFQMALIMLTVLSLTLLFASISSGLLGAPDMHVRGADSYGPHLHWYQDITGGILPGVVVISVSVWVYRILMLLWSLWLAFALVGWLRWGWKSFTQEGYWRSLKLR